MRFDAFTGDITFVNNIRALAKSGDIKVKLGKHTLVISATDAAGNVAKTTYKWRVKKR